MESNRISINIDKTKHKKMKIYCAELGISIKDLILSVVEEKLSLYEDQKNNIFK